MYRAKSATLQSVQYAALVLPPWSTPVTQAFFPNLLLCVDFGVLLDVDMIAGLQNTNVILWIFNPDVLSEHGRIITSSRVLT